MKYMKIRESKSSVTNLSLDNRWKFKGHMHVLCCAASYKTHALRRIRNT